MRKHWFAEYQNTKVEREKFIAQLRRHGYQVRQKDYCNYSVVALPSCFGFQSQERIATINILSPTPGNIYIKAPKGKKKSAAFIYLQCLVLQLIKKVPANV